MQELFKVISSNNLTPNQTYLLYSIRNQDVPEKININMELRILTPEWVNANTSTLTMKSINFLNQIDTISSTQPVKKQVRKVPLLPSELMGETYLQNIATYRELFPPGMLPSKIASRISVPELEKKFSHFFTLFNQYSWEQILRATQLYVEKFAEDNYMYMKNSGYFIYKEDKSGARTYELASRCDMLDQAELPTEQYYHQRAI